MSACRNCLLAVVGESATVALLPSKTHSVEFARSTLFGRADGFKLISVSGVLRPQQTNLTANTVVRSFFFYVHCSNVMRQDISASQTELRIRHYLHKSLLSQLVFRGLAVCVKLSKSNYQFFIEGHSCCQPSASQIAVTKTRMAPRINRTKWLPSRWTSAHSSLLTKACKFRTTTIR